MSKAKRSPDTWPRAMKLEVAEELRGDPDGVMRAMIRHDLLVVAPCLRVIDVEIKISRADLKADKDKDKWWRYPQGYWPRDQRDAMRTPREWPRKVWKHYYAMPAEIWRDDLLEHVQPASGVLLLHPPRHGDVVRVQSVKRAQPNRDAVALDASAIMQLARLTSLRMWDAYKKLYPVQVG